MKITKFGHCCLLIEDKGKRILVDPGSYTTEQNTVKNIDFILITHEHQDHFHLDSLKQVLKNNPEAKIITNNGVGTLLAKENIDFILIEHGQSFDADGVSIEGFGEKHAYIRPGVPQADNTGYFIANRFFYPGDAFTNPNKAIDMLALPVAGPWLKISDVIEYVELLKPKNCFPVHDGMMNEFGQEYFKRTLPSALAMTNIILPKINEEFEV